MGILELAGDFCWRGQVGSRLGVDPGQHLVAGNQKAWDQSAR